MIRQTEKSFSLLNANLAHSTSPTSTQIPGICSLTPAGMFSVLLSPKLSGIQACRAAYRETKIQPQPNPSLPVGSPSSKGDSQTRSWVDDLTFLEGLNSWKPLAS